MRNQQGYIWRVERSWYGRWYRDEFEKENVVRRQHSEKLVEYSNRFRSKSDVQPLLDEKLRSLNDRRARPEGTLTVAEYAEKFFLPYAESELKPSTSHGYKGLFRMYLRPRVTDIAMRDFRCVDATNILKAIHRDHKLSRKSLRHCKGLLSTIFMHAKQGGTVDGINPVEDAGIPKSAKSAEPTVAYSPQDVISMLDALTGIPRAAVALMFFCGLRPGEARATRWSDYDEKKLVLRIKSSMWRKLEGPPKTEASSGIVPVARTLADILAELPRSSEFILAGPSGRPIDLHNVARRTIVPALKRCAECKVQISEHAGATHAFELDKSLPIWRGWYGLRRGLATAATSVDTALAAKSLLRHSNVATTQQFYIKSVPAEAVRAMDKVNSLFDNVGRSGAPN